jgi:hypothetical protein
MLFVQQFITQAAAHIKTDVPKFCFPKNVLALTDFCRETELEKLKAAQGEDTKILHNIAVCNYYKSGCSGTPELC